MDFDIVIATRNRQHALQLSLPLMLAQSRLPRQLIVVDSSDNHEEVRRTVEQAVAQANTGVTLQIMRSNPGSSLQRNVGLKQVKAPVVLFPDDDALWFPHVADSLMRIYERDGEGLVGGVGATDSPVPPPGVLDGPRRHYRMETRDRLQLFIGRFLDWLESRLFPDPFFMEARARYDGKKLPDWLVEEQAVRATIFAGFRMSFRTDLIAATGFDEALGTYALFEDYDACLNILKAHILVDTGRAWVFHHRSPEKRVNGFEWGVIQILNRAYILCKHAPAGSPARTRLRAFSYYKLARYFLQAHTFYGRDRVKGVLRALPLIPQFSNDSPQVLTERYTRLRNRCLMAGG